jgi:AcrR family transcriptional regulator
VKQTQRKTSSIRKREIALAVLSLIGERGASALRAATIAERVGVTPGALFRHFKSVDEILAASVDMAIELVEETFPDPSLPAVERLEQMVLTRIAVIRSTPGLSWLLLSDQVFLTVPTDAVKRLRKLVKRSREFLLSALREGAADGSLRDDIEPRVMLVLLSGTVHALSGSGGAHGRVAKTSGSPPSPQRVVETLLELLGPLRL